MVNEKAKNGLTVRTDDITDIKDCALDGRISIDVPGYATRTILVSTIEFADGIANLLLADFNGKTVSFVEEEDQTTVFIED